MKLKVSELHLGFHNKTFNIFPKDLADRGTIYKKEIIVATLSLSFYHNIDQDSTHVLRAPHYASCQACPSVMSSGFAHYLSNCEPDNPTTHSYFVLTFFFSLPLR